MRNGRFRKGWRERTGHRGNLNRSAIPASSIVKDARLEKGLPLFAPNAREWEPSLFWHGRPFSRLNKLSNAGYNSRAALGWTTGAGCPYVVRRGGSMPGVEGSADSK